MHKARTLFVLSMVIALNVTSCFGGPSPDPAIHSSHMFVKPMKKCGTCHVKGTPTTYGVPDGVYHSDGRARAAPKAGDMILCHITGTHDSFPCMRFNGIEWKYFAHGTRSRL